MGNAHARAEAFVNSATRIALAASAAMLLAPAMPAAADDEVLQKVVIVSRHGIRTPTIPATERALWTPQTWPAWTEPPGNLTARGARLVALVGRYHHDLLVAERLFPEQGCPSRGSVYVYADLPERTRTTAQALLDGLAPGCGLALRTKQDARVDGLFHPLEAGVCRLDPLVAQEDILKRASGDLNRATLDLKGPLAPLQSALECCKPALCAALGRGESCKLPDLPTAVSPLPDGRGVELLGALAIASEAAESFLLEYAEGLEPAMVAWGRLDAVRMQQTFRLHTEAFDLMERTPYLARRQGSALLMKAAAAITSGRSAGLGVADNDVRDAKFVAYIGHDTNIANLAAIIDVSWTQLGYQRNQTPPAGALMFELRQGPDRKQRVYTSYIAQSLEQMRGAKPLTLEAPPAKTPLKLPGCSMNAPGYPCLIEEFAIAVRNAIDRECVE
jgi:4-phytase/acid phosphatase